MGSALEQRVVLGMATSKDVATTSELLAKAGIESQGCANPTQLPDELAKGAGAFLLVEEVLGPPVVTALARALHDQPPWSDLPVMVLARQGAGSSTVAHALESFPNVTVFEKPVRMASLVAAVRSALRARRRQYELRDMLNGLREADQRKTEFLATLAHELRNPLAPISNVLTLLSLTKPDADEAARYHALMRRQVDHMVRLVDELMEVSRITRGKIEMQRTPVLLQAVINDAVEQCRASIEAAGHALTVDAPHELMIVRGDAVRLTQVFSNLLNNGAKYTPPGGALRLTVRREGGEAVVDVTDDGVGLAPHMLEPIFDMFVQVSERSKLAQGGLGIGLTLAKSLVEMHGGTIAARSAGLGLGSTFTVRLPLESSAAPGGTASVSRGAELPRFEGHVLVVDDNRDAADSLVEVLRSAGASVAVAYGGEAALRLAGGRRFDAAVIDIGMPEMDGCELAMRLRTHPAAAELTLIALTGWGQEADRQRVAAAGFDHHLLKPVEAGRLVELLAKRGRKPPAPAPAYGAERTG